MPTSPLPHTPFVAKTAPSPHRIYFIDRGIFACIKYGLEASRSTFKRAPQSTLAPRPGPPHLRTEVDAE